MSNVKKLVSELKNRQDNDGVVGFGVFSTSNASVEKIAKGALTLLHARTVKDNDLF